MDETELRELLAELEQQASAGDGPDDVTAPIEFEKTEQEGDHE